MAFTIKVNGRTHSVDVDGDTPLLWVLRDVLGMTGTKFGCGMALCGACTVHVDGVAIRSCITPVDSIGVPRSRRSKRSALHRSVPDPEEPGSTARCRNAAIASRGRSCRRRRCWRAARIQPMPTSRVRCRATSAGAGLMSAFAKPSSRPRSHPDREADHDHGSYRATGPIRRCRGDLSRRSFLRVGAAGGGLMLSLRLSSAETARLPIRRSFAPNAFIRIGSDGQVVLTMPYVEMGQGTYTSIPMLIAEELEVSLRQVRLEHAPPNEKLYANPLLGVQATGNSNAMRGAWKPLREAGAAARVMLMGAAAKRWGIDPNSCRAQDGEVVHAPSGRRLKYGELVADAAKMPVPAGVPLKAPADFKLIGTPAKRLDTPAKVNGTAVYGIDARPPGVKDRNARTVARVRRTRKEPGRHGGESRRRRTPDRAPR